jgi:hypothetical protein
MILGSRKFKILAVASWLGYWLLYAISGGMFFYYSFDLAPLLKTSAVPNPYFFNIFVNFISFYDSGMIWFPTAHLQVNLLYGPTFFSIILSTLFSLNIVLTVFSIRFTRFSRRTGPAGLLALIPAFFSGGCCSVPFGLALIGLFAPTVGLTTLVYDYPYLINLAFFFLMFFSLVYVSRRVVRLYNPSSGRNKDF